MIFCTSGQYVGEPGKSGPWNCLERKIAWAEAKIWGMGAEEFLPLGPRAIFLGRPKRPSYLFIIRMNQKSYGERNGR
jgi:hypothetical protein